MNLANPFEPGDPTKDACSPILLVRCALEKLMRYVPFSSQPPIPIQPLPPAFVAICKGSFLLDAQERFFYAQKCFLNEKT